MKCYGLGNTKFGMRQASEMEGVWEIDKHCPAERDNWVTVPIY